MLRDIKTTGYGRAVGDVTTPDWFAAARIIGEDKPGCLGPNISEYCYYSHPPTSPFPSAAGSLRLPVVERPEVPPDDSQSWVSVDSFGAAPTAQQDSSAAIQKAMDLGATTVFLPGPDVCHEQLVRLHVLRRSLFQQ